MDNTALRNGVSAVVEFEYTAKEPDELTLVKGAILHNIKVQKGGWWEGTLTSSGRTGMFPDNFVKVLEPNELNPVVLRDKSATVPRRCKAVYSYTQNNNDELTLAVNDVIDFIDEVEEGWWRGRLDGKTGVFPSNFVMMMDTPTAKAAHRVSHSAKPSSASGSNASSVTSTLITSSAATSAASGSHPHPANSSSIVATASAIAYGAAAMAKQMSSSRENLVASDSAANVFDAPTLPPKPASPANDLSVSPCGAAVSKPDRPPASAKILKHSATIASSESYHHTSKTSTSSSSSNAIGTALPTSTSASTIGKDAFGSRDSLNESPASVIPTGNVAAYRKSLEKHALDLTGGLQPNAPVASASATSTAAAAVEKPVRKSDLRKSLENLDEKSAAKSGSQSATVVPTTPPPAMTKKPLVPIKKSPTVSSMANSIFSGIKSKVVNKSTADIPAKIASGDNLDGTASSRMYNVADAGAASPAGVHRRTDQQAADFDQVERGQSILPDMRAGRAKAPKRRPPTASAINSFSSSTESSSTGSSLAESNGASSQPNGDAVNGEEAGRPANQRNWEKQKAPWMDELRASQAKKISPNAGGESAAGKSLDHDSTGVAHASSSSTAASFDMSKSFSSSSSTTFQATAAVMSASVTESTASIVKQRNATSEFSNHSSSSIATMHNNHHASQAAPVAAPAGASVSLRTSKLFTGLSSTATPSDAPADPTAERKPRPSSVSLRTRSISPIGRTPSIGAADALKPPIDASSIRVEAAPAVAVALPAVTPENVCPRVAELEAKIARLERVVQQQQRTIDELVRGVRDDAERTRALRVDLDKYAQFVTQV